MFPNFHINPVPRRSNHMNRPASKASQSGVVSGVKPVAQNVRITQNRVQSGVKVVGPAPARSPVRVNSAKPVSIVRRSANSGVKQNSSKVTSGVVKV